MATTQAGFYPVETYRQSSVVNGGTTTQEITRTIAETILADVGGNVKFSIGNKNIKPIQIPANAVRNPNTT